MQPHPLEKAESLEQLRALAMGMKIKVKETPYKTLGVDLPEDIEKTLEWQNSSL
jgi:3-deoxy-manno-octulosonate cytidylyltransferase (CMP-KDO synthetase)